MRLVQLCNIHAAEFPSNSVLYYIWPNFIAMKIVVDICFRGAGTGKYVTLILASSYAP